MVNLFEQCFLYLHGNMLPVFTPILPVQESGYIWITNLSYSDRVVSSMTQYYTTKRDEGDGDLSGCLASGWLGKPPNRNSVTPPPPPPRQPGSPQQDGDLSGCLASGFLGKQSTPTPPTPPQRRTIDNSGDLSGCLSGVLKPKKTAPKPTQPKKTQVEIELDDSPASDWFYLN